MSDVQQVEKETTVLGTTKFGAQGLNKPTPVWATWVFRVIYILTGTATFIVLGDKAIDADTAGRIVLYLTGLDRAVWAITRFIGVEIDRDFNVPKKDL